MQTVHENQDNKDIDTSEADALIRSVLAEIDTIRSALSGFLNGGQLTGQRTRAALAANFDQLDAYQRQLYSVLARRQATLAGHVTVEMRSLIQNIRADSGVLMGGLLSIDKLLREKGVRGRRTVSMMYFLGSIRDRINLLEEAMKPASGKQESPSNDAVTDR